jgi:hypothetical protein
VALVVHLLILWASIALGLAAAWLLGKWTKNADPGGFGPALSFIASSFGLLLGLLVVFAANHYSSTRTSAETEASTFVAMFDTVAGLPSPTRENVQHEIVCYMRSIATDDWGAQEREESHEAPATRASGDRLRAALRTLPPTSNRATSIYGRAEAQITDAGKAREELLFKARPTIPTILWVVVFVGAALLTFLIASELSAEGATRLAALGAVIVMLSFVIGVLVSLDRPFSPVARVEPTALNRGLTLLTSAPGSKAILRPCAPAQR